MIDEVDLWQVFIVCFLLSLFVAGFDYIRVGKEFKFVGSGSPARCVLIQVLADGLTEAGEWFGVQVFTEWSVKNVPDDRLQLHILPSSGR